MSAGTSPDRYRTEQALRLARKNDAMFRNLVENISGAAYRCVLDNHRTMKYISQGVQEITGLSPEDFTGNRTRSFASIIHPDDAVRVDREIRSAISANRPYVLSTVLFTPVAACAGSGNRDASVTTNRTSPAVWKVY